MTGKTLLPFVSAGSLVAVATATLSCTIQLSPTTDAGTVDAGSQTAGEQCNAIALAYCNQAISGCGIPDTLSECVADQTLTCCSGSGCNVVSTATPSALDACTSAVSSEDCNSVVNVGPSGLTACQGVPSQ
jgi:hypothetical protein